MFVVSLGQPFRYLFDAKTATVEQISLFKLICSKNNGLIYLIVLPVGQLHLVRKQLAKLNREEPWPTLPGPRR